MTTLGMLPVVLDKEPAGAEGLVCRGRSDLGLALSVHGGLGMGAGSERGGVCRGRIFTFKFAQGAEVAGSSAGYRHRTYAGNGVPHAVGAGVLVIWGVNIAEKKE